MKQNHVNFKVSRCGTYIDPEHPFLHVTPDFLCECDCCGYGCGEVKCPYCIEGTDFESYCEMKSACLQLDGQKFSLKRDHSYYYQVLQQLHITKRSYCDFVVFAISRNESKLVQERIFPNSEHIASQVEKLSLFWRTCILPEILGRWYTRKMDLNKELGPDPNGGECYCRRTSDEPTAGGPLMNRQQHAQILIVPFPDSILLVSACKMSRRHGYVHIAGSYRSLAVVRKG